MEAATVDRTAGRAPEEATEASESTQVNLVEQKEEPPEGATETDECAARKSAGRSRE